MAPDTHNHADRTWALIVVALVFVLIVAPGISAAIDLVRN